MGYTFINPKRPQLTYTEVKSLANYSYCLRHTSWADDIRKALANTEYGLFPLEAVLYDIDVDSEEINRDYIHFNSDNVWQGSNYQHLDNQPCFRVTQYPPWCLDGGTVIAGAFKENCISVITGIAMLNHFLDVPMWYETDIEAGMVSYMEMVTENMLAHDEDGNPIEDYDSQKSWRDQDAEICLEHSDSLTLGAIAEDEKKWKAAVPIIKDRLYKAIIHFDFKEIERVLAEETTDTAVWLRGIIWLVMQDFNFYEYAIGTDEDQTDSGGVRTTESYVFLWDYGPWVDIYDENNNAFYNEGGWGRLSASTYYFKDDTITHSSPDPVKEMMVCTLLSVFDISKQTYSNEPCEKLHTAVRPNDIRGWQRVLRRRIKSYKQRTFNRSAARR